MGAARLEKLIRFIGDIMCLHKEGKGLGVRNLKAFGLTYGKWCLVNKNGFFSFLLFHCYSN